MTIHDEPSPSTWRYHRQMLLPGVGPEGQRRLAEGHALIIGVGALGTVAAEALCRAGVGRLTLVDRDVVEWTNLQRQTLFDERDAQQGVAKALAAARRLREINSQVRVDGVVRDFTGPVARDMVKPGPGGPGVLLDCTDNFETRFLVNDVSVASGVPYVYAGAVGTLGMSRAVVPGRSACLRCLFAGPPPTGSAPTCDTAGVLGPAAGVAAMLQAGEAIKVLLGRSDLLRRGLVTLDLWAAGDAAPSVRIVDTGERDPGCPCCVGRRFDWLEGREGQAAVRLCGRNAVQIASVASCFADDADDAEDAGAGADLGEAGLERIGSRLRAHGEVLQSPSLVRCILESDRAEDGSAVEITVFADGRAVVKGTQDASRARSLLARYVGG